MASDVRISLFHKGARDLLKSQDIMKALRAEADAIRARAGDGYEVDEYVGRNRARATVQTKDGAAAAKEARDHHLIRALGSSG